MKTKYRFTSAQKSLLEQCEKAIRQGMKQFIAVGQALSTIRQKRLYRLKGYTAFEDYCQKEWDLTRAHASNLILAFATEEELSTIVDSPVFENEFHARQYRQLGDAEKQKIKLALMGGASVAEALSSRKRKSNPADKLKAIVLRICNLLDSASDAQDAFEALEPVLAWCREYLKREGVLKKGGSKNGDWMAELQAKFGKAA